MAARLLLGDPGYPPRLLDLSNPPAAVFVRGALQVGSAAVALVGARRASERGRRLAATLGAGLSDAGVVVVSGGALGIDIAAHRGALRGRTPTLVVLPTPIDRPYPVCHRSTFEAILAHGGAWLSECCGPVSRRSFCARNRLIAALADVVVVVEAGAASGTAHTVAAARRLGRRVAAVPWTVGEPMGEGCVELLRRGAAAVATAGDVLRLLGKRPRPGLRSRAAGVGAPEPVSLRVRIERAMARDVGSLEALASEVGAPVPDVLAELTLLELEGAIGLGLDGRLRVDPWR